MMILFPIICWYALFTAILKWETSRREAFLSSSVLWGVSLALITELLSLFGVLTKTWLAFSWAGGMIAVIFFPFFAGGKVNRIPTATFSRIDAALSGGVVLICFATLSTALLAPPNNWDSMTYHMSRVVHWLQNGSVNHYPTHILRQLELNPWAEFAITHFKL